MSKREVNTPRDGVRSHYIAIDQLYITEENVYLTFAHCYYQNLLLTPSVGIFYHNVLMSLCYNGGCGKLRALYPLLLIVLQSKISITLFHVKEPSLYSGTVPSPYGPIPA